jgi:hypothetical protein
MNGHCFKKYEWKPGDGETDDLYECAECGARMWVQELTYDHRQLIAYTVNGITYSADIDKLSCDELQVLKVMNA